MRTTVVNQEWSEHSLAWYLWKLCSLWASRCSSVSTFSRSIPRTAVSSLLAGLMCCAVRRQTWISCFSSAGKESWGFSSLQLQMSTPTPLSILQEQETCIHDADIQGPNQKSGFLAFMLLWWKQKTKLTLKLQWMWNNIISTLCNKNKFLNRHIKASTQQLFSQASLWDPLHLCVWRSRNCESGLPDPQDSFLQLSFPVVASTPHTHPESRCLLTHQIEQDGLLSPDHPMG